MEPRVDVDVTNGNPSLAPGGLSELTIRIQNASDQAGRFRIAVEGVPPSWIDLTDAADGVRLAAQSEATVRAVLRVPASAAPATLPMMITVTSDEDARLSASTFGSVSIVVPDLTVVETPIVPVAPPESATPTGEPESKPAPEGGAPADTPGPPAAEERPTEPLPVVPTTQIPSIAPLPSVPVRTLEIGPIGLTLRAAGDERGSYMVRLRNGGRVDAHLQLDVVSDGELDVVRPDGPFLIAPGGALEVPLRITPRKSQTSTVPFRVRALGPDQQILAEDSADLPGAPPSAGRPRGFLIAVGAVAVALLVAAIAGAAWLFLLRDDDEEWPERPVLETTSSFTIQPHGDRSVVMARDANDPTAEWSRIAERDADELPGLFATLMARSPDQRQIVFVTARDEQLTEAEFWIVPADGSAEPRRLMTVDQGLWPAPPAWSPDGSRLAFAVRQGTELRLATLPLDGGEPELMASTPAGFGPEAFYGSNPVPLQWIDGQTLGFYTPADDGGRLLHQVDVASGRTQQIAAPPVPQQAGDFTTPCLDTAFSQIDPRWRDQPLTPVGESIGVAGCGLTAAASVLAAYDAGLDPGDLAECLNAQQASAPIDWEAVPTCGDGAVAFSGPSAFSYTELNTLLSSDQPVIVRLKGGPTGEHFVVVNTGPGSGSGLASDFRVTDPWDGTTWKTLAFFTSKGYVPEALIVYQGPQTRTCTVVTGAAPQRVALLAPGDQSVSSESQTFDFEIEGAARGDIIESSLENGATVDDEGIHVITITARRDGEEIPYLSETVAFTIDRGAPRSTARIDGAVEDDGGYVGPVSVDFGAADGLSAVSRIEYRLDDEEEWQEATTDTVPRPIEIAAIGEHTLEYRAVDMAGNEEMPHELSFEIISEGQPASPTALTTATAAAVVAPTSTSAPSIVPTATAPPPLPASPTAALTSTATSAPAPASPTTVPASPTSIVISSPEATSTPRPTATPIPIASPEPIATETSQAAASPTAPAPAPVTPTRPAPATPLPAVATSTIAPTATVPAIASPTGTREATATASPAPTESLAASPTRIATPDVTATSAATPSPTIEVAVVPTETTVPTATPSPAPTSTATSVPTATATRTPTPEPTTTPTATATMTATATPDPTVTATAEPTATSTPRPTATVTPEPTPSATPSPQPTATLSPTPAPTETPSPTATVIPTLPPVPAIPTPAPASPTATATAPVSAACESPIESDPEVELGVEYDLRLSPVQPGVLRFLGLITNDGDRPVEAIITICFDGLTYQPAMIPGAILPGESAPFAFTFDGDDTSVPHDVAVSGFVITEAEIAATQPSLVIVDEEMHDPDTTHPTMWVSLLVRNDGELVAEKFQVAVILYQGNGAVRDVELVNVAPENPQTGEIGLAQGQAVPIEIDLEGIRSLSGGYEIRVAAVSEDERPATPTDEDTQTA